MIKKNNEDMAGSVSEPKGAIPEVKPARSLWPRPHENVRVEPVLDTMREEAPPVAPPVAVPQYEPVAEFSAGPEEGYRAPEPRIDFEDEPAPEVPAPQMAAAEEPEFPIGREEFPAEPVEDEPVSEEAPSEETAPEETSEPDLPREEPIAAAPVREEPVLAPEPEPASEPEPVFVPRREERQVREERHVSVLDRADREKPALEDAREGKAGKFLAMAAGIVVALAIGTVGLVYGAGALGFKFGGGSNSDTTASASAPPTTPAVAPDDLKAMENRVQELQAEIERLRQEKSASAPASTPENQPVNPSASQQASEPANPPAERASAPPPEAQPKEAVASIPGPTPAPNAVNAAPAPTPAAPPPQAVAPAPSSEPTPKASTPVTAPPAETARTEPTPPPAAAPAPPPAPKPKPPAPEVARTEPTPPPPAPSYRTQPGYEDPRSASSPEMPVLQNWAVRDVYNGIAVVQGGRGAPLEVEPGDELPGGNRVLAIRRLGGNWAVITERGIISGY